MSVCYWTVEGVGFRVDDILPRIVPEKYLAELNKALPGHEEDFVWDGNGEFDPTDYCGYSSDYESVGELLCSFDEGNYDFARGTYEDEEYVYLPPIMPWQVQESSPKSLDETCDRLCKMVQRITDMTEAEIQEIIDTDLFLVDCG